MVTKMIRKLIRTFIFFNLYYSYDKHPPMNI